MYENGNTKEGTSREWDVHPVGKIQCIFGAVGAVQHVAVPSKVAVGCGHSQQSAQSEANFKFLNLKKLHSRHIYTCRSKADSWSRTRKTAVQNVGFAFECGGLRTEQQCMGIQW